MAAKTKLELTWIGKDNRPRLEPRILIEEERLSYHSAERRPDSLFDNVLIRGDNLLALKALEAQFSGQVNCVYLDPPYNTGSAFKYYDDGVEHSLWLSLLRERLSIIERLLSKDGHVFAQADDNEGHYLKVLMDEIFGRQNFIATFLWRKVDSPNDNKVPVSPNHEFIFCYAKSKQHSRLRQKPDPELVKAYGQVANDGRRYRDRLLKKNGKNSLREDRPSMFFPIPAPDGEEILPIHDDGREACWALGKTAVFDLLSKDQIIWKQRQTAKGEAWVPYTREWAPSSPTRPYATIWSDLDTTRQTKAHQKDLFGADKVFSTPKPEDLISRILEMCTVDGDLVLDSFAGSGTTGAVAHKMGRRWIMVELGDHCETHIVPRLKKVINSEDHGGITEAVGWKGGGGYRYFKLAPSLLEKDQFDNWVISKSYNAEMLAEAMCKHFGFTYAPSDVHYWMHGHSSETDFIYVTTNSLTHEQLASISDEVGLDRTLLICCKAFQGSNADAFDNLTIRKIPGAILDRCEWGKDDYSLKIEALPLIEDEPVDEAEEAPRRKTAINPNQPGLFGGGEEIAS
ncbi:DNA methylase N-4 [Brevundimonas sp. Leaf280]|uniref:site-specific DNA-methyltransferase n=1 Tax=Brevundimonas sp. Leaf280 TaxID=1736320 RepID=UPI0006FDB2DF|nr:site-specific DNA-methyltransferase [Brevundimonas sp. Leaf280]KQP46681.1 DNA methylase N-4 [Brevundimonas sp. Leaf280]